MTHDTENLILVALVVGSLFLLMYLAPKIAKGCVRLWNWLKKFKSYFIAVAFLYFIAYLFVPKYEFIIKENYLYRTDKRSGTYEKIYVGNKRYVLVD